MANINPLMIIVAIVSFAIVFGLFRRHFGLDTLRLAALLGAIHLISATLVAFVMGRDVVATLTFSYPSHSAALAGSVAIGYAVLLWGLLCASVLILNRLRGIHDE